jgi:3-deoxy-D-arabino-heptulosonate 7-phosphate (DAHP) synthase
MSRPTWHWGSSVLKRVLGMQGDPPPHFIHMRGCEESNSYCLAEAAKISEEFQLGVHREWGSFLIDVSNHTDKKEIWTDQPKIWARKKKVLRKETDESAGARCESTWDSGGRPEICRRYSERRIILSLRQRDQLWGLLLLVIGTRILYGVKMRFSRR